jgi:hypothetical protein
VPAITNRLPPWRAVGEVALCDGNVHHHHHYCLRMNPGEDTRDDVGAEEHVRPSPVSGFLSPPVCAVSAFTLAVVALLGQNVVSIGVGSVLESRFSQGGDAFYVAWGVAGAIQVALVWLLARRGIEGADGWEALLGRAAVLLSFVALAAGALVVLGGVLND